MKLHPKLKLYCNYSELSCVFSCVILSTQAVKGYTWKINFVNILTK